MRQSPLLEFESSAFRIEPGEDEQTNPGIYGRALAQWLSEQLRARGIAAEAPFPEDFGWCVPIESSPHKLYAVCAHREEAANGWRVFAFAEGGVLSRLIGGDRSAESVAGLFSEIRRVLQTAPDVSGLREEET